MIFILVVSLLAALTALVVIFPLLRAGNADLPDRAAFDRAVYKDQLAEIYADRSSGLISAAEAEAARAEIARRLLSVEGEDVSSAVIGRRRASPALALGAAVFVYLGAFGVYAFVLGAGGQPDAPYETRLVDARTGGGTASVRSRIELLREEIRHDTYNPALRMRLAFLLLEAGSRDEARYQAGEAARLAPEETAILSDQAVITVMIDGGTISQDAHDISMRVLRLDRTQLSPRAFLGFERQQSGDLEGAVAIWKDTRGDVDDATDLARLLDARLRDAAARGGIDIDAVAPRHPLDFPDDSWQPLPPPRGKMFGDRGGNGSDRGAALSGGGLTRTLSDVERGALEANVEIVTRKLEASPGDFDAWMQLARTRRMLADYDAARAAYRMALDLHPKDTEARRGLALVLVAGAESRGEAAVPAEAVTLFQQIVREGRNDLEALFYLGQDALNRGEVDRARGYWSDALLLVSPGLPLADDLRRRLDSLDPP